jgi:hypothetical protein
MENEDKLLVEITSGDPHKIWASSNAIVRLRDAETLDLLAEHLPEIKAKTAGIELGGALFPNSEHLKTALHKLDFWKKKKGCLCRLYPGYLLYDPQREEKSGNVRIIETHYLEGGWVENYVAECTVCGTRFEIEERESHYTWWSWKIVLER